MSLRWLIYGGLFSLLAFGHSKDCLPQTFSIYGKITDHRRLPLLEVNVEIIGQNRSVLTNIQGNFALPIPSGSTSLVLAFSKAGYRTQTLPVEVSPGQDLILPTWAMIREVNLQEELPTIDLQDLQPIEDQFDRSQIGSVLHAQRDPFLNAAAFQWSSTFFRLRGLDSRHNAVTLNGIPMNAFDNGRPQWSSWGGLNDFTNRTQQFRYGIASTENHFGGLLGHSQIELRPSDLPLGSKISQAFSNATYQYRSMVSHSGTLGKRSRYAFLFSYRGGRRGYIEGTPYEALSGVMSIEKNWSDKHHTWVTALYTPNRRGKSAPMTQEVFDLKGRQYNPYWGLQNGQVRNAREVVLDLPMIFFNHEWQGTGGWNLRINAAHQWGKQSSGRMYYNGHQSGGKFLLGGGQNPDPTYYQKLPSYFLRTADDQNFKSAYLAQKTLVEDGQMDWNSFYETHKNQEDGFAVYALYQDVKAPQKSTAVLRLGKDWISGFKLNFNGIYRMETTAYYATPSDLLGADYLGDYNPYAPNFESVQNDLNQPDLKVVAGTPFLYHYDLETRAIEGSVQAHYQSKGFEGFLGVNSMAVDYRRIGKFKNGGFPQNSFGEGATQAFMGWQFKGGIQYAFSGRFRFFVNGGLFQLPPTQQNLFANPRENHAVIPLPALEKHLTWDGGFQFQSDRLELKLLVYRVKQEDLSEVSYYFADGVGGDHALFVQEILSGLEKDKKGLEFYCVFRPVPELKITGVAALGQHQIANHPQLFLSAAADEKTAGLGFENGFKNIGQSRLNGYALAGGPQRVFTIGMDYEDPNYWRMGIFGNYFSHAYLDPNPLLRTSNFLMDYDGLPFPEYQPDTAQALLKQESFPGYFLLNATGGKSWRIGSRYFGFFISIQNLLNTTYKTGGFQQGRNANYRSLLEDQSRELPLFGPKYWWGRGTTYFASIYLRF